MGLPGSVSAAGADIPGLGDPGNAFCSSCVFGHCLVRQSDGEFVGEAEDFDCCCCWGGTPPALPVDTVVVEEAAGVRCSGRWSWPLRACCCWQVTGDVVEVVEICCCCGLSAVAGKDRGCDGWCCRSVCVWPGWSTRCVWMVRRREVLVWVCLAGW